MPGVTGALVAEQVPHDRVLFEPSWSEVAEAVARRCEPGDLVVTFGAGDVTQLGPEVLRVLEAS